MYMLHNASIFIFALRNTYTSSIDNFSTLNSKGTEHGLSID